MSSFWANFILPKKLRTQTVSTENRQKKSYKKAAHKMWVTLTPECPGVAKIVFHVVAVAVTAGSSVTQVA